MMTGDDAMEMDCDLTWRRGPFKTAGGIDPAAFAVSVVPCAKESHQSSDQRVEKEEE